MKFFLTTFYAVISFTFLNAQVQKGQDIYGDEDNDLSGWSVSMPDANTMAVGAKYHDELLSTGQVRIFNWSGSNWVQKGQEIVSQYSYNLGYSISMPDSNTVAIGAPDNEGAGQNPGHVRIYEWAGSSWIQKGNNIVGEAVADEFGLSVSMPDVNTVAIGAPKNDGNGNNAGHVRVFSWNGTNWLQKGQDLDGEAALDISGTFISMPDSNTVAIGAPLNDGTASNAGHARVFEWNGSAWIQKGMDIDGEASNDFSGRSVSMPDVNTIAVGALGNDGIGVDAGHVRIYEWDGSTWIQKGSDINGEASGSFSGYPVSMPDASTIGIGAYANSSAGFEAGQARIYEWNGSDWIQKGVDIEGEAAEDNFGNALSMPDANTIGIGGPQNDGSGTNAGHARVYNFCTPNASIDPQISCDSFTWIDGNTYTTSNNTATHILTNVTGCDSIVTLNLTVNDSDTIFDTVASCSNYTWPVNGVNYNQPGIYQESFINQNGCDSIHILNLSLNCNLYSNVSVTNNTGTNCNGSAVGNAFNGSSPYSFEYSNGQTTSLASNLCEGVYDLVTTDSDQNVYQTTFVVSDLTVDYNSNPTYQNYEDSLFASATANCDINYSLPIDSFYVDQNSISQIETNLYQVVWYVYQNSIEYTFIRVYYTTEDINGSFAFTLSFYCQGPTRSTLASYNLIYKKESSLSTKEEKISEVIIYPNPTTGKISISMNKSQPCSLILTDLKGNVLKKIEVQKGKFDFDISSFSEGSYFLHIVSQKDYLVKKLIKK